MVASFQRFEFLLLLFHYLSANTSAWGLMPLQQRTRQTVLCATSKNDDADAFRDQAQQLRQEIEQFETSRPTATTSVTTPAPTVTAIPNSVWTLQYRCSAEPVQEEDDTPTTYYSGTVTVRFRADGYTDLIEQTSTGNNNCCLTFTKAWGWDIELDREQDTMEYVLFSVDASLPSSDSQRFYWQAQLDKSEALRLVDGTVTVKQDVIQKDGGGGWFPFLLSPAGILAQFRSVGAFVARPTVSEHGK